MRARHYDEMKKSTIGALGRGIIAGLLAVSAVGLFYVEWLTRVD